MHRSWTQASQLASTSGTVVCAFVGCALNLYGGGFCSDHYEAPPVKTCRHRAGAVITCGCCKRICCASCYGAWNALACVKCRVRAAVR